MGGPLKIAAARGNVHRTGQPAAMVEQRRNATSEDAILFAEVLVSMYQDRSLLGERGTDPIRSFAGFRKVRSGIDLPVAEHPLIFTAGETTDQHRPIYVSTIDAISGIAQDTR